MTVRALQIGAVGDDLPGSGLTVDRIGFTVGAFDDGRLVLVMLLDDQWVVITKEDDFRDALDLAVADRKQQAREQVSRDGLS